MSNKVCMLMAAEQPGSYLIVAKALHKSGFSTNIICLGHKSQPAEEVLSDGIVLQRINKDGIFYSPFTSILNPMTTLTLLIRAIRQKATVYWCHGFAMLTTSLVLKLFRKRVIYDVGDDSASNFSYVIEQKFHLGLIAPLAERLFRAFERFCIKRVNYVITLTESLKKDRVAYAKKIKAIYYCPDPSFYKTTPDEKLSDEYRGRDVIVYSGTISFMKAFGEVLETFELVKKESPRALLLLVGGVLKAEEREICKVIAGKADISMTGWLTYEEMPKYISLGKVGLALIKPANYSYKISLPFKILEQMACGLPIIAPSGFPEIERIINEAHCGFLVDVNEPVQIAEATLRLLRDDKLWHEMSSNAVNYVKEHHNIAIFEKETIAVFQSLLKNP